VHSVDERFSFHRENLLAYTTPMSFRHFQFPVFLGNLAARRSCGPASGNGFLRLRAHVEPFHA
jgi:hypothetical protein